MSSEDGKPQEKAGTENAASAFRPKFEWDDTEITFSDFVLVQAAQDGFVILSFFQGEHPYLTEEERPQLALHCVSRLAVSIQQFDRIIELYKDFQGNLKEFSKTQEKTLELQMEGQE